MPILLGCPAAHFAYTSQFLNGGVSIFGRTGTVVFPGRRVVTGLTRKRGAVVDGLVLCRSGNVKVGFSHYRTDYGVGKRRLDSVDSAGRRRIERSDRYATRGHDRRNGEVARNVKWRGGCGLKLRRRDWCGETVTRRGTMDLTDHMWGAAARP